MERDLSGKMFGSYAVEHREEGESARVAKASEKASRRRWVLIGSGGWGSSEQSRGSPLHTRRKTGATEEGKVVACRVEVCDSAVLCPEVHGGAEEQEWGTQVCWALPGLQSNLPHFWAHCTIPLCFGFLIWKIGVITVPIYRFVMKIKWFNY